MTPTATVPTEISVMLIAVAVPPEVIVPMVTSSIAEANDAADLILCPAPAFAQPAPEGGAPSPVEPTPPPSDPVPVDPVDARILEGTKRGTLVRFNRVAPNFFSAFDVPVSIGRGLTAADASADADGVTPGVLVSRGLVDQVFSGANPLGRRIKYGGRSSEVASLYVVLERWYEIVGVVPDFPLRGSFDDESEGRVYHAVAAAASPRVIVPEEACPRSEPAEGEARASF